MITTLLLSLLFLQNPDDAFVGQKAPELKPQGTWINTTPLKLDQLHGKVVLIEFFSWDCPFCAEAMPHIKEFYDKYSKSGLVVLGVHTPRVEYEKDVPKIKEAITAKGLKYPIVVDNEYEIWSDYACGAWPSIYILDQNGVIQLNHTGTGRYDDMEEVIKKLLSKNSAK